MKNKLRIRHFGAFGVFLPNGGSLPLGSKHQALLALLSTAEGGVRTRAFLERTLWGLAQPEQAKASLRTALSTLRRHLGRDLAGLLSANRERVILDLANVEVDADPSKGDFMEGFELPHETTFAVWLEQQRNDLFRADARNRAATGMLRDYSRAVLDSLSPPIAVLPFVHRATGEAKSPLGALLSEELVRHLSRSHAFCVTSYLASRQFDPHQVRPSEVYSVAGANYLVSGTVNVTGQTYRLQVDLHDAERERVIWSRDFTETLSVLTNGNSSALREVTAQIGWTVVGESVRLVGFRPLSKHDSHTLLMAAIALMQDMQMSQFNQAQDILAVLLEREVQHPVALTWMAMWHVMRVQKGFSTDRQLDAHLANQLVAAALAQDPSFSLALTVRGLIASHLMFRFDLAQDSYDLALKDNPNEALALLLKGTTLAYQDKPEDAVQLTDAARRLSPLGPQRYYFDSLSATTNLGAQNYERAVRLADRSLQANPTFPATLRAKAIALQAMGQQSDARDVVKSLMAVQPEFSISLYEKEHAAASAPFGKDWSQALKTAGVPA
ncbi:transcriptional regulator [Phaeobacter porticola]|uniref:Transcriptional regulatory protein n=1 Tax=Phaeobacter porticola TaxID=1844006 RepID=A0A1L3I0L0_9RHOB|nr:transcriptional regulator [Phaeobacter porticola]APG45662.1 Transcriptional regulatory protein [Phaeobacter porticola]